MMSTITLAGDYRSALTHFALYGTALVAETELGISTKIRWTNESVPRAELITVGAEALELAESLMQLALRLSVEEGWVNVDNQHGSGKREIFSPFSPRFRTIDSKADPEGWSRFQKSRHDVIDQLLRDADTLSLRWIAGLGEASYWHFNSKKPRPDEGASRWEMKARNSGQDFVQHRLRPMCAEIAKWSPMEVLDGLNGDRVHDSLDDSQQNSRTSTGFTPPGKTDVALAFAGLIGIANFPVIHQVNVQSITPGAWPPDQKHPTRMMLPLMTEPLTLARVRSLLRSQAFFRVLSEIHGSSISRSELLLENVRATSWLKERGVKALVDFPILLAGGDKPSERQIQGGEIVLL